VAKGIKNEAGLGKKNKNWLQKEDIKTELKVLLDCQISIILNSGKNISTGH
jgi:hypothetical protein